MLPRARCTADGCIFQGLGLTAYKSHRPVCMTVAVESGRVVMGLYCCSGVSQASTLLHIQGAHGLWGLAEDPGLITTTVESSYMDSTVLGVCNRAECASAQNAALGKPAVTLSSSR